MHRSFEVARVSVRVRAREYSSSFRCQFKFECWFVSKFVLFVCFLLLFCLFVCVFFGEKFFDVTSRVLYFVTTACHTSLASQTQPTPARIAFSKSDPRWGWLGLACETSAIRAPQVVPRLLHKWDAHTLTPVGRCRSFQLVLGHSRFLPSTQTTDHTFISPFATPRVRHINSSILLSNN